MDPNYSAQKMDGEPKNDLESMPCVYLQVDINLSKKPSKSIVYDVYVYIKHLTFACFFCVHFKA